MLLFCYMLKTLGSPVSLFGPDPIQMAWAYLTTGGPRPRRLDPPLLCHLAIDFCPPQRGPGSLTGPLSQPEQLSAALVLPCYCCRACQSCYFRDLGRGRDTCAASVCERQIQSFLSTSRHPGGFPSRHATERKHVLPSPACWRISVSLIRHRRVGLLSFFK